MEANVKISNLLNHLGLNAKAFSERLGYPRPQIIYDIIKGKTKRISEDLAVKISTVFPEVSKSWLLADEGEMLKDSVTNIAQGDNATNIAGNGNNIRTNSSTIDKALDEIAEQRKLVAKAQDQVTVAMEQVSKSQQQIDRLLSILEMTNNV